MQAGVYQLQKQRKSEPRFHVYRWVPFDRSEYGQSEFPVNSSPRSSKYHGVYVFDEIRLCGFPQETNRSQHFLTSQLHRKSGNAQAHQLLTLKKVHIWWRRENCKPWKRNYREMAMAEPRGSHFRALSPIFRWKVKLIFVVVLFGLFIGRVLCSFQKKTPETLGTNWWSHLSSKLYWRVPLGKQCFSFFLFCQ